MTRARDGSGGNEICIDEEQSGRNYGQQPVMFNDIKKLK